jgi:hypothetical protein
VRLIDGPNLTPVRVEVSFVSQTVEVRVDDDFGLEEAKISFKSVLSIIDTFRINSLKLYRLSNCRVR